MKKSVLLLLNLVLCGLFWSCEVEADDEIISTPQPLPVPESPPVSIPNSQESSYDWRMVVKSVDSFTGGESNAPFKDILMGKTLQNGIATTNTTFFRLKTDSNKVELKLIHAGWTIWEGYGFYPIVWEFTYKKTLDTLELEGFANMGLSNCELPEASTLINRFYFKGQADKITAEKYVGTYVWSETFATGTCIKIQGGMEVIKNLNNYPVY